MRFVSRLMVATVALASCGTAMAEGITAPSAGQVVYQNDLTLTGNWDAAAAVQWAVRFGTCAANTNTVAGNVDGYNDSSTLVAGSFNAMLDVSALQAGQYCFVLNFAQSGGPRYTQNFYIVDEFAKVSGNLTSGSLEATSKAGTHAFQGVIGTAGASGTVGSIFINYRALGIECTFTPGSLVLTGNDPGIALVGLRANATGFEGTCSDTTTFGNASIFLLDRDASSNRNAPRGAVVVRPTGAPDTGPFEIDGTPGVTGPESWVLLTTGNVHVGSRNP